MWECKAILGRWKASYEVLCLKGLRGDDSHYQRVCINRASNVTVTVSPVLFSLKKFIKFFLSKSALHFEQ